MVRDDDVAIKRWSAAIDDVMGEPPVRDQHRSLRESHVDSEASEFQELICPGSSGIDQSGCPDGVFLAMEKVFYHRPLYFIVIENQRNNFCMKKDS